MYNEEIGAWERGDWVICNRPEIIAEFMQDAADGCRVCWMNESAYEPGMKWLLQDMCSCGTWICKSVYECLRILKAEEE